MARLPIIYTFLLLLLFSSCKKNFFDSSIDVKVPEHEPQLTVTAHLFANSPNQMIFVNHSRGILDSAEIKPVTNAVVDLYEGNNLLKNFSFLAYEDLEGYGRFTTDSINFISGKTYTLKVESTQYGSLESSQTAPTKVAINNATYEKDGTIDQYGERVDEISIEFDDPEGERNYYAVSVLGSYLFENKDTSFTGIWGIYESPVDPILEEARGRLLFSDASLDGNNYTLKFGAFINEKQSFRLESGEWIDGELLDIEVTLSSVSQDYYSFWKSMETFGNNQGNIFAEPTNVYENVEGGIGIFTLNSNDEYIIEF